MIKKSSSSLTSLLSITFLLGGALHFQIATAYEVVDGRTVTTCAPDCNSKQQEINKWEDELDKSRQRQTDLDTRLGELQGAATSAAVAERNKIYKEQKAEKNSYETLFNRWRNALWNLMTCELEECPLQGERRQPYGDARDQIILTIPDEVNACNACMTEYGEEINFQIELLRIIQGNLWTKPYLSSEELTKIKLQTEGMLKKIETLMPKFEDCVKQQCKKSNVALGVGAGALIVGGTALGSSDSKGTPATPPAVDISTPPTPSFPLTGLMTGNWSGVWEGFNVGGSLSVRINNDGSVVIAFNGSGANGTATGTVNGAGVLTASGNGGFGSPFVFTGTVVRGTNNLVANGTWTGGRNCNGTWNASGR